MSLVDYDASSSEEEDEEKVEERENLRGQKPLPRPQQLDQRFRIPPNQQPESSSSSETSNLKLPDASLLLNASDLSSLPVSGNDHSSRVAAALVQSASRKREVNGPASVLQRNKVPRGNLPHIKSIPDTTGGLLVPPQLSGRSNVVTEDISKLFVRKDGDPHLNRSESAM